jgi:hypothetical protein
MAQKLADALNHCEEYWGPKCRVTDTYLGPLTHAILSMHDHRPAIRLRPDGTYERVAYSLWDGVPGEGEV